jgi:hypothetical protein
MGGTGPGTCASGTSPGGFSASLNAAANLVQSVVKAADPYKTTVKNFENGYAQAQLSTPGQLATITRYPSGATHTSIRHNSDTYQKWKNEMEKQKKGSKPSNLTGGNPKNTIIGDEYEFTRYMSLKGVQTGKDTGVSPTFRDGDKIQFVKKNTKSIVIKCVKKIVSKNEKGTIVKTETNPDTLFRIDIDSLYYNIMHDTNFKASFHSYIKRKESLEELGI